MKNIKLTIEYDGREFHGWQKQNDKLNIQGEIERAIRDITGEEVELIGSGRTDRGVHALNQVANFKLEKVIDIEKLPIALNSKLKKAIVIKNAEYVDDNFNSRKSSKKKTYNYIIDNSKYGSAIYRELQYHFPLKLDEIKMNEAIKYLIGEHDFKSFKASGNGSKSSVRTIYDAYVKREEDKVIISLTGNGFLYNMVRIIAGTLIDVGLNKIKPEDMKLILESKDRTKAGKTISPCGLYLVSVEY